MAANVQFELPELPSSPSGTLAPTLGHKTHQADRSCPVTLAQNGSALLHLIKTPQPTSNTLGSVLHDEFWIEPIKESDSRFTRHHKRVVAVAEVESLLSTPQTSSYIRNGIPLPVRIINTPRYDRSLTRAFTNPLKHRCEWPITVYESAENVEQALHQDGTMLAILIMWSS